MDFSDSSSRFSLQGTGKVTLSDKATIKNRKGKGQGGGVEVAGQSLFVMEKGSLITDCEAEWGGGVSIASGATFEMNGALYVPFESLEEIMGWGKSKVEYDYKSNILHFYEYKLNAEQNGYAENNWFYTVLGSYEGRFNGRYKTLSKSTMVANGKIYVPLSFLSECAGFDVASLGGGVYTVGNIDSAFALSLLGYLG